MLKLNKVRDLNLPRGSGQHNDYVYSASGLVEFKNELFIVADTELSIAIFPSETGKEGRYLRLFPGEQPSDSAALKKVKPDLESIAVLPESKYAPQGALLMVPSLSRANRVRGALLTFNDGEISAAIPIDFSEVHKELSVKIKELNIEGIAITDKSVKLFHRGSKGNDKSAVIDLDLSGFINKLFDTHQLLAEQITGIKSYDLGERGGCDLAFTDAFTLPDGRIIFLAAAENSSNAYDDGVNAGSAIGILSKNSEIERIENIEGSTKLEGVCAKKNGSGFKLKMVSDSDDEKIPSGLYSAVWSY